METVAGTVAAELSLAKLTTMGDVPAGDAKVTVPVDVPPAFTLVGFKEIETNAGGLIVRVAVWSRPGTAVMVARVLAETVVVFTVKVPLVSPCGITIVIGGDVARLSLCNRTVIPLAGAGMLIVTVPVLDCPPFTLSGTSLIEITLMLVKAITPSFPATYILPSRSIAGP